MEYEYKLLNQTQIYRGKFPANKLKKLFDNSDRKSKKKKKKAVNLSIEKNTLLDFVYLSQNFSMTVSFYL